MNKKPQILKSQALLKQALDATNGIEDRHLSEARAGMKRALTIMNEMLTKQERKTANLAANWNTSIQSGIANIATSPMTHEAAMRSLKQIDLMIAEQQKLLERPVVIDDNSTETGLLSD